jgi:hypothetical protein
MIRTIALPHHLIQSHHSPLTTHDLNKKAFCEAARALGEVVDQRS